MKIVEVRNIKIGDKIPKICVPIVGVTKQEIIDEAENIKTLPVDIVEWRADWFQDAFEIDKIRSVLFDLRRLLVDIPILFTFRTSKEGGEKAIDATDYLQINRIVIENNLIDLVDVEFFMGEDIVKNLIETAHENGVKVIASNHDFNNTPNKYDIIDRLCRMRQLGADILKIAVMPTIKKDVITLLDATLEMYENFDCPIITMSMGDKGVISRLSGEAFGSAVTFGSAKKISAPGQINVIDLNNIIQLLHKCDV